MLREVAIDILVIRLLVQDWIDHMDGLLQESPKQEY